MSILSKKIAFMQLFAELNLKNVFKVPTTVENWHSNFLYCTFLNF